MLILNRPLPAHTAEAPPRITHTIESAVEQLGCGRTTIYALIAEKKLEALKLGRRTLITDASLRALVASLPRMAA